MKKLILACALILSGAHWAHAGVMIEPYLGLENGKVKQAGSADSDYGATIVGARLGYNTLGLMFGLDYMKGDVKVSPPAPAPSYNTDSTDMGVYVGYQFPIMLQAYYSYFFDSKSEFTSASKYTGKGNRIGIGWTGLPFVVINVEVVNREYDKWNGTALTAKLKTSGYAINISIPLP